MRVEPINTKKTKWELMNLQRVIATRLHTCSSAIRFSCASSPPSDNGSAATKASNCTRNSWSKTVAPQELKQLMTIAQKMSQRITLMNHNLNICSPNSLILYRAISRMATVRIWGRVVFSPKRILLPRLMRVAR